MRENKVILDWLQVQRVVLLADFDQGVMVSIWWHVVVLRAIHSLIVLQLYLCLFHGCLDHGYYEVSLARHHGCIEKLLIVELYYNLILLETLIDSLKHTEVVSFLAMVFVSVHHQILYKV